MRSSTIQVVTVVTLYQSLTNEERLAMENLAAVMVCAAKNQGDSPVWMGPNSVYYHAYEALFILLESKYGTTLADKTMARIQWNTAGHELPEMGFIRMSSPLFDLLTAIEKAHS